MLNLCLYLSVEEAVERGDEETLEGGEEVRHVGPKRELPGGTLEGPVDHVDDVGDAQQRQQHHRGAHRLPAYTHSSNYTKGLYLLFIKQVVFFSSRFRFHAPLGFN